MALPLWLPATLELTGYNQETLDDLYRRFMRDLVRTKPTYSGLPVRPANMSLIRGKQRTFWHLISSGPDDDNREIDLVRCRHIPWIASIIENCQDPNVLMWERQQKRQRRVKLWLRELDYVIILGKRPAHYDLITAFVITYDHSRRKLQREYDQWVKSQKPPTI